MHLLLYLQNHFRITAACACLCAEESKLRVAHAPGGVFTPERTHSLRARVGACVRGRLLTSSPANRRCQRGFTDWRAATTAGRLVRSVLTTSAPLRHL